MLNLTGQQYSAGTCAEDRSTPAKLFQCLKKVTFFEELQHGGGFTAGQHKAVERPAIQTQIFRVLHQRRKRACIYQCRCVRGIIALNSQYTDAGK